MYFSFFIALLVSGYLMCEYDIQRTNEIYVNLDVLFQCAVISLILIKSKEKEVVVCELNKQVENIFLLFLLSKRKHVIHFFVNKFITHLLMISETIFEKLIISSNNTS
jgi:hypothetical protein